MIEQRPQSVARDVTRGTSAGRRAIRRALLRSACVYLALMLGFAPTADAVAKTFTGTTSDDWFTASNWMPTGVPAATDDVSIAALTPVSLSAATAIQSLALAGTLTGAGDLTVTGRIDWTAGTMSGGGATHANGGVYIVGNGAKFLDRALNNGGAGRWADSGAISVSGTFNNLQGASLTIVNDRPMTAMGPAAQFNNAGTVVKMSGAQRSLIRVGFNNTGVVSVQSGTLALGGGTHSGSFDATGGTLELTDGDHALGASSSISGGAVIFSGGTVAVGGTYSATATTISRGNVVFTGSIASIGALTIANGTATFDNPEGMVTTPSLLFSAGTIAGASDLNVEGLLTWRGGTMGGMGVTNANAGLSLEGSSSKHLERTLNLAGVGSWTASGNLGISGTFNIRPGATFEARNDRAFSGVGTTASVHNDGTFRKIMGTLTSMSAVAFENRGAVEILSGTLSLTPSYVQLAGVTRLMSGTTLRSSTAIELDGGRLEGNGTIDAAIINNAEIAPGLSPGRLATTRSFEQSSGGALAVELGGTTAAALDQLVVDGAAGLGGTLKVTLLPGFTPQPGDRFKILTFATHSGDFASTSGLVLGSGRGFTKIVGATDVVLEYSVESCGDGQDNDNDMQTDCDDPKCVDFPACVPVPTATASPTPTPCSTCTGDCDCNANVSSAEIFAGIELALDGVASGCASYDVDGSAAVDVYELVAAVTDAHGACAALPTPTPTM